MANTARRLDEHDPEIVAAVLAAWRQGHDTRAIVTGLFRGDKRFYAWMEPRVCEIIAAEQDRRHAKRCEVAA